MIKELRNKVDKMLLDNVANNDKYIKLVLIKDLLKNDNLFFDIIMETALNILYDLDYDERVSLEIYGKLISNNEYNNE